MTTYACRECGDTEGFYTVELIPERFYFHINVVDGAPDAEFGHGSQSDGSPDGSIESWNCGCGASTDLLEELVEAVA